MTPEQFEKLPPLFQEIIRNENKMSEMFDQKVLPFGRALELIETKRRYMKAAKIALHWDYKSRG